MHYAEVAPDKRYNPLFSEEGILTFDEFVAAEPAARYNPLFSEEGILTKIIIEGSSYDTKVIILYSARKVF